MTFLPPNRTSLPLNKPFYENYPVISSSKSPKSFQTKNDTVQHQKMSSIAKNNSHPESSANFNSISFNSISTKTMNDAGLTCKTPQKQKFHINSTSTIIQTCETTIQNRSSSKTANSSNSFFKNKKLPLFSPTDSNTSQTSTECQTTPKVNRFFGGRITKTPVFAKIPNFEKTNTDFGSKTPNASSFRPISRFEDSIECLSPRIEKMSFSRGDVSKGDISRGDISRNARLSFSDDEDLTLINKIHESEIQSDGGDTLKTESDRTSQNSQRLSQTSGRLSQNSGRSRPVTPINNDIQIKAEIEIPKNELKNLPEINADSENVQDSGVLTSSRSLELQRVQKLLSGVEIRGEIFGQTIGFPKSRRAKKAKAGMQFSKSSKMTKFWPAGNKFLNDCTIARFSIRAATLFCIPKTE